MRQFFELPCLELLSHTNVVAGQWTDTYKANPKTAKERPVDDPVRMLVKDTVALLCTVSSWLETTGTWVSNPSSINRSVPLGPCCGLFILRTLSYVTWSWFPLLVDFLEPQKHLRPLCQRYGTLRSIFQVPSYHFYLLSF